MDNGKGGDGMQYAARLKAVTKGGAITFSDKTLDVQKGR